MASNYRKVYKNGCSMVVSLPAHVVRAMGIGKHTELKFTVTGPQRMVVDVVPATVGKREYDTEVVE